MTIKERVFKLLQDLCDENKREDFKGITANEIAEVMKVQRNVVSQYLNELCREGLVIKTNTRPVYFFDAKWHIKKKGSEEVLHNDPFSKVIGHNGSLKEQIEQCKAAAVYQKGLPITLTGNSGVGKKLYCKNYT